ncbi:MAG: hypothetical protein HYV07_08815 [Deltaproteobacteria bacterium]|nr:hypothetical protein [Deltaproteobacteria bacterium]
MQTSTSSVTRVIDLPAREAAKGSNKGLRDSLVYGLCGLGSLSMATTIAGALSRVTAVPALSAAAISILVVGPGSVVAASYLRLKVPVQALAAAFGFGVFGGGLVALCFLPLVAFVSMVDRTGLIGHSVVALPTLFLVTVATYPARVLVAIDPSPRAKAFSVAIGSALFLAFVARLGAGFIGKGV